MSPSSSHASEPSAGLPTPKRAAPAAFRFAALFLSLLPLDAVTLEEARAGAKLDLEDAQRRLSQLRARIEEEKLPILREVNRLEHNATQKRKKYDDLLRSRDNRDASLLELREDVEEAEAELAADLGLLRDYARSWRNALPAPAKAALADELAAALIVPPEHESPMEAALAARLRVARLSLSHLRDACGGMRLEGEAIVPPEGERKQGAFLLLGPLAFFSEPGGAAGIVAPTTRGDDSGELSPATVRAHPPARSLATPEPIADAIRKALAAPPGKEITLPLDPTLGKALVMETGELTLMEELAKGGIWIYPILLFAALSALIALCKAVQILRVRPPLQPADLRTSFTGPFESLRLAAEENAGRSPEVLEEILYERIIDAQVRLEKTLPLVAVTAAAAPLLGLLGTVTGMIDVFRQITNFANPEDSELARGISEALVTTKFGLVTAIPALIVHALLSRRLQGLVAKMETFASRLVHLSASKDDVSNNERSDDEDEADASDDEKDEHSPQA